MKKVLVLWQHLRSSYGHLKGNDGVLYSGQQDDLLKDKRPARYTDPLYSLFPTALVASRDVADLYVRCGQLEGLLRDDEYDHSFLVSLSVIVLYLPR